MAILDDLRNKFIDFDARRQPETDLHCIMCQKDLDPTKPHRSVYLAGWDPFAIHPADAEAHGLTGALRMRPIGNDCARKLGLEWTVTENEASRQGDGNG
jgi:hypothetical protein